MELAPQARIYLKLDGQNHEFDMEPELETILQAGLDKDLNLPYSCMGGACSTCRARLVEGEVEMDCNLILSDTEVADRYILTCQARPITDRVVIDYDQ